MAEPTEIGFTIPEASLDIIKTKTAAAEAEMVKLAKSAMDSNVTLEALSAALGKIGVASSFVADAWKKATQQLGALANAGLLLTNLFNDLKNGTVDVSNEFDVWDTVLSGFAGLLCPLF